MDDSRDPDFKCVIYFKVSKNVRISDGIIYPNVLYRHQLHIKYVFRLQFSHFVIWLLTPTLLGTVRVKQTKVNFFQLHVVQLNLCTTWCDKFIAYQIMAAMNGLLR